MHAYVGLHHVCGFFFRNSYKHSNIYYTDYNPSSCLTSCVLYLAHLYLVSHASHVLLMPVREEYVTLCGDIYRRVRDRERGTIKTEGGRKGRGRKADSHEEQGKCPQL